MRYFLYKQSFITKEETEFISLPYNLNKSQFVAVLDNLSEEEDCTVTMKLYNQRDELVQSFDNLLVQKFNDLYTDIFEMEPNFKLRIKVDDTSSDEIEVHFSLLMIISKDLPVPPKIERPALFIIKNSNNQDAETGVDLFWKRIQSEVRNGTAREKYGIGHQFYTTWTDEDDITYNVPLDVVHYGNVELRNGNVVPGMYLQWRFSTPYGVPFDWYEALYYTAEGLSAGTYYVTAKGTWSNSIVDGDSYSFTLTKPIPAGGQICVNDIFSYAAVARWRISTYKNSSSITPIESDITVTHIKEEEFGITVPEDSAGTFLGYIIYGTVPFNNDPSISGIPQIERIGYGYNRWSMSTLRQWLNSSAEAGKWWVPQNKFDRPWPEDVSKRGFMAGLDGNFVSVVSEVKVVTSNNYRETMTEDRDITYDKFFLPSLEQEFIDPHAPNVEGEVWEFWKLLKHTSQSWLGSGQRTEAIRYDIINQTPQPCRLRSAERDHPGRTWYIYPPNPYYGNIHSGLVYTTKSIEAVRCAPACVIC